MTEVTESLKASWGTYRLSNFRGEAPSQAIDLWACGIILFELLSGERVFTGENELDVMLRIRSAKVPALRKIKKDVPKELEKILEQALHKKEKKRFADAATFLDNLQRYQNKNGRAYAPAELVQSLTQALT